MVYPSEFTSHLVNGFVQDEISIVEDVLSLTAGVKLEYADPGKLEPQPSVRLAWHPVKNQTVWAAWSLAIRTPSEVELNSQVDAVVYPPGYYSPTLPAAIRILGTAMWIPSSFRRMKPAGAGS